MKHSSFSLITKTLGVAFLATSFLTGVSLFTNKNVEVVHADAPSGYYSSVTGTSAEDIFRQVRSVVSSRTTTSYNYLETIYADSDVDEQGYIVDIYSNTTSYKPNVKQCGNYKKEGDCWNKEHSIPKSWWGGSTSNQGADPFIVYPSDGKVNGMRSNYSFGIVGSTTYTSNNDFSKLGSPKSEYSEGAPNPVFEPNDEFKGDLARAVFYACEAYSGSSGWTSGDGSKIFTKNGVFNLTTYARNLFIKWHLEDPVSDFEARRNDAIYQHTHNRNPFIDHPEWVTTIWGDSAWYDGSYEQTAPTSLSLNKETANIGIGSTLQLRAYANSGASNSVSWSSSVPGVATINASGLVTAIDVGETTITATSTLDSSVTASCVVTVNDGTVDIEGVSADPISVKVGKTATIVPVVSPVDASPLQFEYESTNENVATVTSSGVVTGVAAGNTTITITVTNTRTHNYATCVINVGVVETQIGSGDYIKIKKTEDVESGNYLIVYEAGSLAFDGSLTSLDSVRNSVSVTITNEKISHSETLDESLFTYNASSKTLKSASGYYIGRTANSNGIHTSIETEYENTITVSNGVATITSSAGPVLKFNNASGQERFRYFTSNQQPVALYKQDGEAAAVGVVGVKLDNSELEIGEGDTATLVATVMPSDATNKNVSWESDNTSVATVSDKGVVTGVNEGTTIIRVTTEDGDFVAECEVTVIAPVMVEEIIIDEDEYTLEIGDTTEIDYFVEPYEATNQNVTWTSSNSSVATVSDGLITAKAAGTATITITAIDGSGIYQTITINVLAPKNTIRALYNFPADETSSYSTFYGLYMGYYEETYTQNNVTKTGYNLFIGNGDYAIMLYHMEDEPTYIPYGTYVSVSGGSLKPYKNLYEITNECTVTEITAEQAEDLVEPLVLYKVLGNENGSNPEVIRSASRPVLISGTVASISGTFVSGTDTTVTVNLSDGGTTNVFCKKSLNNLDELKDALGTEGKAFTIRGFTSIFTTSFQIVAPTVVKVDENYTAENFAQDLLEATDTICSDNGATNHSSALSAVWGSLKMNKFSKLGSDQITILREATASSNGTTIQNAMARYDHICQRYGLENFIGRTSANHTNILLKFRSSDISLIGIIVATALGAAFVGCMAYKKRRIIEK